MSKKMYCNCKTKSVEKTKKIKSKKTGKLVEYKQTVQKLGNWYVTETDSDDVCLNCGYYAVYAPIEPNRAELRWTESKWEGGREKSKRDAELYEHIVDSVGFVKTGDLV